MHPSLVKISQSEKENVLFSFTSRGVKKLDYSFATKYILKI
jgi:hypothetical protein